MTTGYFSVALPLSLPPKESNFEMTEPLLFLLPQLFCVCKPAHSAHHNPSSVLQNEAVPDSRKESQLRLLN